MYHTTTTQLRIIDKIKCFCSFNRLSQPPFNISDNLYKQILARHNFIWCHNPNPYATIITVEIDNVTMLATVIAPMKTTDYKTTPESYNQHPHNNPNRPRGGRNATCTPPQK